MAWGTNGKHLSATVDGTNVTPTGGTSATVGGMQYSNVQQAPSGAWYGFNTDGGVTKFGSDPTKSQQAQAPAAPASSSGAASAALTGLQTAGGVVGGGMGGPPPAVGEPAAGTGAGSSNALTQAAAGAAEPTNLFVPGTPGTLRQGMGQRLYPLDIPALQGLARAY